jgi:hypothetical protein
MRLPAAPRPCPAGPTGGRVRWNRDAAPAWPCPPAWWVGRSPATRPRAVTPGERPEGTPAAGIIIPPGSGMDKGRTCSCWPKPDDARPCTPQTCDWRCRACRVHGRPFYSHGDLRYLEHGTGPLAAELDRLWRVRGAGKRRTVREGAGDAVDGWRALPRGAAGLVPRRLHPRMVTDLYYPRVCRTPHQAMAAATPAGAVAEDLGCRLGGLPCRTSACR